MRPLLLLLLLAFAVHAPSLGNGFALDDRFVASPRYDNGAPNPLIATLQPVGEYFGSPYWRGIDRQDALWRPVAVWSYAAVHWLAGRHLGVNEALPQHAVNVLLFVGAVWLLWTLLTALGLGGAPRTAAAAVFAVHAIHVEAVAPVVGRAELLALGGGLGFVLLGGRAIHANGRGRLFAATAAALALFVGVASKETAFGFVPLAILVWTAADRRDAALPLVRTLGRRTIQTALLALPPVAFALWLRAAALATLPTGHAVPWLMNPLAELPLAERLPSAVMLLGFGLWKLLVPWPLACDYGACVFRPATGWTDLRVLAAAVALTAPTAWAATRLRRDPLPLLAAAATLGLAFVTSNLAFPIGVQFAERSWFAPSLGCSLAIAAAWPGAASRWRSAAAWTLAAWCAASATAAFARTFDWRDNATLFATDARTRPESLFVQINAGVLAGQRGDAAAHEAHLRAAVAAAPDYGPAWGDLGQLLHVRNDLAGAEAALRRGLACKRLDPATEAPTLQLNLALVLLGARRGDEAIALLGEVAQRNGPLVTARLAVVYPHLLAQVSGERLRAFLVAGMESTGSPAWRVLEGIHLEHLGRHHEAIDVLTHLPPGPCDAAILVTARLGLARAFAGEGRTADAIATCRLLENDTQLAPQVRDDARALRTSLER